MNPMKKQKNKNFMFKFFILSIFLLSMLTFLLTGCRASGDRTGQETAGNGSGAEDDSAQDIFGKSGSPEKGETGGAQGGSLSWQADFSRLETRYDLALATDNAVYGCYSKNGQAMLDRIDKESLYVSETFTLDDTQFLSGMAADSECNVYLLAEKDGGASLRRIDPDGSLHDPVPFKPEETEEADTLLLKGIYTDPDGCLYVWCGLMAPMTETIDGIESKVWYNADRVYVMDGQLRTLFYEEIADIGGTRVLHFQIDTDGTPLFLVKDRDGLYTQEIDVSGETLREAVRLDKASGLAEADSYGLEHIMSIDGGFLYCCNNDLFTFHYDTQKTEKVLNLPSYGIFSSDILCLAQRGEGYEIIDNHGDSACSELISLALGQADKKLLTLGVPMIFQELESAVAEFNRYNSDYRVEILDYSGQADDYGDAGDRLRLDIVTGNAPDILAVSGIDYHMFSDKGVLADLYDFLREDAECSESMLVPSVVRALEDDGCLYSISPSFLLHSMWGYGDVTGGRNGVTFEELFRILGDSGKDLNAIAGFAADEPVLTRLCTVSMDEFVDWENRTCSFDSDYFKEVLSFAKEYTGNYTGGSYSKRIHDREVVMSVGILTSVADYQIQDELYGHDVAFIGYPVAEGSGTAVAYGDSALAINARNEDPAGAWEFVKFYLLHGYDGLGFPILQEQLDQVMAEAMEENQNIAEDGGTERYPKGSYLDSDANILVYAASQKDIDAVTALIDSADCRFKSHVTIQDIINEEAEAYFLGQVDLDKTVEKIQNRVSLLLQE